MPWTASDAVDRLGCRGSRGTPWIAWDAVDRVGREALPGAVRSPWGVFLADEERNGRLQRSSFRFETTLSRAGTSRSFLPKEDSTPANCPMLQGVQRRRAGLGPRFDELLWGTILGSSFGRRLGMVLGNLSSS